MKNQVENRSRVGGTPFVVGVTGHRNLHPDELLHLRDAVADFLRQLKSCLADTELRIAVGMAQGADLLVAQTALELGVRVNAMLPMPLEQYSADFDADALETMKSLLQHPDVDCVELLPSSRSDAGALRTSKQRDATYANLTEMLIQRTSLLLALWDGQSSELPGGTADTVLRYLGLRTQQDPHASKVLFVDESAELDSDGQLVYWIPAGRNGSETAEDLGQPCFLSGIGDNGLLRQPSMPAVLVHQLAELDEYNREFHRLEAHGDLRLDSLMASLPADMPLHNQAALAQIDAEYGKADVLAVHYQKRSDRLFEFFSLTTFAMAITYLGYERLSESRLLLYAYLLFLLSGLGLYFSLHGRRWFSKHLMYRVLAETMRAKFFLRLSGADHLVDAQEVLSLSGIDRFHGFAWISSVLKSIGPAEPGSGAAVEPSPHEAASVERAWIQNQENYFVAKVARLERNSRRIGWSKNWLFLIILLVVLVLISFEKFVHATQLGLGVSLKNLLTFFMGFGAVLFGVWELHQNKMASRELLWQYRNQLSHFSRARAQLSRTTAWSRRREILAALGKDSLMESCLWTIHRYHREHEPPATS